MGIIGIAMSILMRMQLAWPEEPFVIFEMLLGKWAEGGVMDPSVYLALVTIHGTIMVFFVLTAGLSGTFSNLLIPLQIGARDMASGFLNMVSYWLFFLSSLIMVMSLFVEAGPASAGWTIYSPLSALPQAIPGSGAGMTLWLVSMAIFIAASLLLGYLIDLRGINILLWALLVAQAIIFFLSISSRFNSFAIFLFAISLFVFFRKSNTASLAFFNSTSLYSLAP